MARGIQNKLLEAMAMGLPTVVTSAAVSGVDATDGSDTIVADGPSEFADGVLRLLKCEDLRTRIGQSARATIEARYRWETSLARLDTILDAVSVREPVSKAPARESVSYAAS
jgi:glycosyltransferase involved in cell wall biosynthesis